ncbi:NADH-cytochrome b5 reductase-like protein [Ziziphus jujuba]|uniref:NADH-cytochrome b5 reductase-like protein n=1 Tax=Ziziphus jujuba TaxID=326968 RepID=A0ABM4A376_ZIZJJ|nr:NADH-cytochrome b5 reductase-like protein [Ziziphus jujuba]
MATFFQRLSKATAVAFANAFGSQPKSGYRIPFRALAAVCGGISYLYYVSSPDMIFIGSHRQVGFGYCFMPPYKGSTVTSC